MVAVAGPHQQNETAGAVSTPVLSIVSLRARGSAYLIDSLVLVAVVLVFLVLAGVQLLRADQQSPGDPPDGAYYAFTAIFLGGTLIAWSSLNLSLMISRGQTAGMYVLAILVLAEDGSKPSARSLAVRWFALHPLLFHPALLIPWMLLVFVLGVLSVNQALLAIAVCLALLCIVAPLVSAISLFVDPHHRSLSDRLSHTVVSHLEAA